ncbi:hypothetical protein [uncultured Clostridium sp.]|uniref:hypothetical protein n=1 Tax=uncultured Clostridium sp. TaxID=59620 RepID=UPI0028E8C09C|nr:hypothetical protein [uncultured Clostridium sp.]
MSFFELNYTIGIFLFLINRVSLYLQLEGMNGIGKKNEKEVSLRKQSDEFNRQNTYFSILIKKKLDNYIDVIINNPYISQLAVLILFQIPVLNVLLFVKFTGNYIKE